MFFKFFYQEEKEQYQKKKFKRNNKKASSRENDSFVIFSNTRKGMPSLPKGKKESIQHFLIV